MDINHSVNDNSPSIIKFDNMKRSRIMYANQAIKLNTFKAK